MSEEFLTGLITGVLATTIGFSVTLLWDLWKLHRVDRRKTTAVLLAIAHELKENLEIVKVNRQFLEADLPILKEGKHLMNYPKVLMVLSLGLLSLVAQANNGTNSKRRARITRRSNGIRSNTVMSGAREIGLIQRSTGMWRKVLIRLIGELTHR